MSVVLDIAQKVANALNAEFADKFAAEVQIFPRTDLQNVKGVEVFVCPDSIHRELQSRSLWSIRPSIQVGILKKINKLAGRDIQVNEALELEEQIAMFLGNKNLDDTTKFIQFNDTPLCFYEHYSQYSVFTTVLSVQYSTGLVKVNG